MELTLYSYVATSKHGNRLHPLYWLTPDRIRGAFAGVFLLVFVGALCNHFNAGNSKTMHLHLHPRLLTSENDFSRLPHNDDAHHSIHHQQIAARNTRKHSNNPKKDFASNCTNAWKFDSTGHYTHTSTSTSSMERTYLVHAPSDLASVSPRGVVLSFHGESGTSAGQEAESGLSQDGLLINGKGIFAIYPQGFLGIGKLGGTPQTAWEGAPYASPVIDDVRIYSNLNLTPIGPLLTLLLCTDRVHQRPPRRNCRQPVYRPLPHLRHGQVQRRRLHESPRLHTGCQCAHCGVRCSVGGAVRRDAPVRRLQPGACDQLPFHTRDGRLDHTVRRAARGLGGVGRGV